MKIYDPVLTAKDLLDELVMTKAYLGQVSEQLKKLGEITEENAADWEELYRKEFDLSMRLSGIHGDINLIVKRELTPGNEFQIKRVLKEADKVFKPLVLEIK